MKKDLLIQILKGFATDSKDKPNTSIDYDRIEELADALVSYSNVIPDVSAILSSSLGECVEGNDYEIVADKDGRFWINHKEVGSGEPLEQWINSALNVR